MEQEQKISSFIKKSLERFVSGDERRHARTVRGSSSSSSQTFQQYLHQHQHVSQQTTATRHHYHQQVHHQVYSGEEEMMNRKHEANNNGKLFAVTDDEQYYDDDEEEDKLPEFMNEFNRQLGSFLDPQQRRRPSSPEKKMTLHQHHYQEAANTKRGGGGWNSINTSIPHPPPTHQTNNRAAAHFSGQNQWNHKPADHGRRRGVRAGASSPPIMAYNYHHQPEEPHVVNQLKQPPLAFAYQEKVLMDAYEAAHKYNGMFIVDFSGAAGRNRAAAYY